MMKTTDDIYDYIGIPCYYCKYAFSEVCSSKCINYVLSDMIEIATDMVLRGEY